MCIIHKLDCKNIAKQTIHSDRCSTRKCPRAKCSGFSHLLFSFTRHRPSTPLYRQSVRPSFVWSPFDKTFSCALTLPQRLFAWNSPISYHHDRRRRCQVVQKMALWQPRPDHKALHIHTHSLASCESENSFIWVSSAEKKGKVARRSARSPDSCWGKSVSCSRSSPRSFANGCSAPQDD